MPLRMANKDWKRCSEVELEQRAFDAIPMVRSYDFMNGYERRYLGLSRDWETEFQSKDSLVDDLLDHAADFAHRLGRDEDIELFELETFRQELIDQSTLKRDWKGAWVTGSEVANYYFDIQFQRQISKSDAFRLARDDISDWRNAGYDEDDGSEDTCELELTLYDFLVSASEVHLAAYGCLYDRFSKSYSALLISTSAGRRVQFLRHDCHHHEYRDD